MTFYNELEDDYVEPEFPGGYLHDFDPDEDGECIHCGEPASRNHHGWMS